MQSLVIKHNPTSPELSTPPKIGMAIGKSMGFSAVEVVLPKGTKQSVGWNE